MADDRIIVGLDIGTSVIRVAIGEVDDEGELHVVATSAQKSAGCEPKIATLYYKPANNKTDIVPDFYLHSTNEWIVFPHELEGLTLDEIRCKDPDIVQFFT